jgi:hypothetical protein
MQSPRFYVGHQWLPFSYSMRRREGVQIANLTVTGGRKNAHKKEEGARLIDVRGSFELIAVREERWQIAQINGSTRVTLTHPDRLTT